MPIGSTATVKERPSICVVVPAYGACPQLGDVLGALLSGTVRADAVVISHSGASDPTEMVHHAFPSVTVLHSEDRLYAGSARNRGAALAQTDILAFCDADTIPDSEWLAHLLLRLGGDDVGAKVVVGSVGVHRSGGYWGMSNWLLEFSELAPWRSACRTTAGASCNMAVPAGAFRAAGGFPDGLRGGEDTVLLANLRSAGLEQVFEPAATVRHANHRGFRAFARHQLGIGKGFAEVRSRQPMRGSGFVSRPALSLPLFAPKAFLVLRRTFVSGPRALFLGLLLAPGVLIGSVFWSFGCFKRARFLQSQRTAHRTLG